MGSGEEYGRGLGEPRETELARLAEQHEPIAELIAKEHRYEAAFRTSPSSMSITSMVTGQFVDLNAGTEVLLGYSQEELLGRTRGEMNIWADEAERDELFVLIRQEGRLEGYETSLRRKDGEIRRVKVWASVVNIDGDPMLVTVARDVTEEQKVRDELALSEHRYNVVFRNSPFLALLTDLESGVIVDANAESGALLGFEADELVGRTALSQPSIWPFPAERAAMIERLERDGQVTEYQAHLRRKDGIVRQVLVSAALMNVDDSRMMLTCAHDVTEQRLLELALEESEERYRLIFDSIADAAYVHFIEPHGKRRLLEVNGAACRMLGYTRDELLSKSLIDIDAAPQVTRKASARLASGGEAELETLHRAKDGRLIPVEVHAKTLMIAGQPAILSLVKDISERRDAEEALRDHANQLAALAVRLDETSQRERRRLAEAVHDRVSQTLVAALIQLGEATADEGGVDAEALQAAKTLVSEAIAESRNITTDLTPPVLYELGLARGVLWLAERVQELHGFKVRVFAECDDSLLSDDVRLAFLRAAQELLANAATHSKARGASVELSEADGVLTLSVEDDGIGFDAHVPPRTRKGCYGLLSLRERATSVGGEFEVVSERGRGTRVTLRVPV